MVGQVKAGGICVRVGGNVENTLKGGETEQRGGDTKILKKGGGGASWVKGWVPEKGGLEPPYELCKKDFLEVESPALIESH